MALGTAVAQHEEAVAYAHERGKAAASDNLRFLALAESARKGRAVTKTRLRFESLERALSEKELVVAPEAVRVWVGRDTARLEDADGRKGLVKERSQE